MTSVPKNNLSANGVWVLAKHAISSTISIVCFRFRVHLHSEKFSSNKKIYLVLKTLVVLGSLHLKQRRIVCPRKIFLSGKRPELNPNTAC